MNARFEITVGDSTVVVRILHGRKNLRAFVNNIEQKATENTCKFHFDLYKVKTFHDSSVFILSF